jgi:hypothetical protein
MRSVPASSLATTTLSVAQPPWRASATPQRAQTIRRAASIVWGTGKTCVAASVLLDTGSDVLIALSIVSQISLSLTQSARLSPGPLSSLHPALIVSTAGAYGLFTFRIQAHQVSSASGISDCQQHHLSFIGVEKVSVCIGYGCRLLTTGWRQPLNIHTSIETRTVTDNRSA